MMNQVSLAPSQTALERIDLLGLHVVRGHRTADAENRLQVMLPKPSLPCLSAGVAVSVIGVPPRSI